MNAKHKWPEGGAVGMIAKATDGNDTTSEVIIDFLEDFLRKCCDPKEFRDYIKARQAEEEEECEEEEE